LEAGGTAAIVDPEAGGPRRLAHPKRPLMLVWIDIENPPQVQYLAPFKRRFEELGAQVAVTARDYGIACELLRNRGIEFSAVGGMFGRSKLRKVAGTVSRARQLAALFRGRRPDLVLSASRPAALAARLLRIPAFIIDDYEYADVRVYALMRCWLLHPDVIPAEVLCKRGLRPDQLVPFRGIKEDISFADADLAALERHRSPGGPVRVLFRPPASEAHYYDNHSGELSARLLAHLSRREDVVTVYAPRYEWQAAGPSKLEWRNPPERVEGAAEFLSLLASVDAVISSGGTMVREAAYLGIPAYSILQSRIGAVDRYLESLGRLRILSRPEDFDRLELRPLESLSPLPSNPGLLDELVGEVTRRVEAIGRGAPRLPGRRTSLSRSGAAG
jgi:predicted glycosyltransferase